MNKHSIYLKFSRGHCLITMGGALICVGKSSIKTWQADTDEMRVMKDEVMHSGRPVSKYDFERALRKTMDHIAAMAGFNAHLVADVQDKHFAIAEGTKDLLPQDHKPWLNPGTRDWDLAIDGLQAGTTTIEHIRTTMRISKASETRLNSEVAFLTHHKGI